MMPGGDDSPARGGPGGEHGGAPRPALSGAGPDAVSSVGTGSWIEAPPSIPPASEAEKTLSLEDVRELKSVANRLGPVLEERFPPRTALAKMGFRDPIVANIQPNWAPRSGPNVGGVAFGVSLWIP